MIGTRTAAKNVPISFSQMSTTTPFLYQTRTLNGIALERSNAVFQPCCRGRSICRNLSGSTKFQYLVDRPTIPTTTSASRGTSMNGRPSIKSTNDMSEPPSAGIWAFDRKNKSIHDSIERQGRFKIKNYKAKTYEPDTVEGLEGKIFPMPDTTEFDEDFDHDPVNKDEIQQLTDAHQNRGSTITMSERRAFQKIFSDMFEGPHRSSSKKEDFFSDDNGDIDAGPRNRQKAKTKLDNILTRAMRREASPTPGGLEAAVERYPPALRAAAARAMGLINAEASHEEAVSRQGKALDTEELEALREPERARVEGLMKNAKSDFELWEVLEKEVFPLIAKLNLEDAPKVRDTVVPQGAKMRKRRKKSVEERQPKEREALDPNQTPVSERDNGVSPLSLYGPLYPSYLLLALRLLDRGFAKPSTFALSILPRIKSLGFVSHVLGGSTQFYNELLRIYRYRQDDFRGMINLLLEMENSALDFDEETLEIVLDVTRTQRSVLRGEKGPAIRALWSMPEFAPNKFRPDSIRESIGERKDANSQFRY